MSRKLNSKSRLGLVSIGISGGLSSISLILFASFHLKRGGGPLPLLPRDGSQGSPPSRQLEGGVSSRAPWLETASFF